MPIINFPYGKGYLSYEVDRNRFAGCLEPDIHKYIPPATGTELVSEALENPICSQKLSEMAKKKKNIVILCSDHTRPVPSKIMIPLMLKEIRKGNPAADITLLIATGCHRAPSAEELSAKFGEEIVHSEKIVIHNCDDRENMTELGTLPSGGKLVINKLAAKADLLVAEGFIEPHFFAGFSGGRKSVLPGIASRETVMYNHNAGFIQDECSRTGILEQNPIHRDMMYAAKKAGLAFICNVILNSSKEIIYAVAGDAEAAHEQGCRFLLKHCEVKRKPCDIVITTNGGYPLDQNIYQSVKGMTAAEATVKKNGVIIMIAKADDGHGGERFYRTFAKEKDLDKMQEEFLATLPEKTIPDQWQSQILARILSRHKVIFVSDAPSQMVEEFQMIPAKSIEDAVEKADRILSGKTGEKPDILCIPDGVSVIVK